MNDEPAGPETGELLSAIGKVAMPEPRVLDDAREVLWSAIAGEMLGTGPSGGPAKQAAVARGPAGGQEDRRRAVRRRQTERSPDDRRSTGGGGSA